MARKKTISMGSKMAIATAQCKKKGLKNFKKGGAGNACRERVARGIEKKYRVVHRKSARRKK